MTVPQQSVLQQIDKGEVAVGTPMLQEYMDIVNRIQTHSNAQIWVLLDHDLGSSTQRCEGVGLAHQTAIVYQAPSMNIASPSAPSKSIIPKMKSGGGVLIVAAAQILVGLCLLGIYEGYKSYYYNTFLAEHSDDQAANAVRSSGYEDPLDFRSPMGASYYIAILNNVFAVFGLAGILNAQRELIIAFFGYNAAQMVVSFHYFVDLCTDATIQYSGEPSKLTAYEQATTAFIFFNVLLSISATVFAVRSMDEIKAKQREEYNRFTVLGDTLQYEADHA